MRTMENKLSGRSVLVTGGAGFVGSALVRLLIENGAKVTVVDNLVNGKIENLHGIQRECLSFERCDIRDHSAMKIFFSRSNIVFHLACLGVRHSIHSPKENQEVNAVATFALLDLMRHSPIERFVYVSTSEVYGTARDIPMTESHPTFPLTIYGASKLAGESYTRAFFSTFGCPTVVVRPFNSYGPRCHHEGDSGEVIPKFMLRCLANRSPVIFGDGSQTRDFTFVDDTARGIMLAGVADNVLGETINIGSDREISIRQLLDRIKAVTKRDGLTAIYDKARPGDVGRLWASASKARHLLGYSPSVSLDDGLKRLLQWYRELRESPEALLNADVLHNWVVSENVSQ